MPEHSVGSSDLGKALHKGLALSHVKTEPDMQELLKDPHFHAAHP
jgi:hypothetical protein